MDEKRKLYQEGKAYFFKKGDVEMAEVFEDLEASRQKELEVSEANRKIDERRQQELEQWRKDNESHEIGPYTVVRRKKQWHIEISDEGFDITGETTSIKSLMKKFEEHVAWEFDQIEKVRKFLKDLHG